MRPRLLWGFCVLICGAAFAALGALGGYTGIAKSEYRTGPDEQAIIVGIMCGLWGLMIGFVVGVGIDVIRWLRWEKEQPRSEDEHVPDV